MDEKSVKITPPLISAEKMSSFPRDESAMFAYLNDRIQKPQVVKGLGYGCGKEAPRITRLMPN